MRVFRAFWFPGLVALFFWLFTGCSNRPKFEILPLPDPFTLMTEVVRNQSALRDYSGSGSIAVSGPDLRKTVLGIRVYYLTPDRLSLNFKGPLGISVGSLILVGDQYQLKLGADHKIIHGRVSEFVYPLGMNLLIGGKELREIMLPLIAADTMPDSMAIARDDDRKQFKIEWSSGVLEHHLWKDPYRPLFLRKLNISSSGDTVWDKQIGDVNLRAGVYLPNEWMIKVGQGGAAYQVKLDMIQIKVNTGLSPDHFDLEIDSSEVHGGAY
jgi:outer membrane lipoprotein-sorting protein